VPDVLLSYLGKPNVMLLNRGRVCLALFAILAATMLGCGGGTGFSVATPVSGTVTLNGQPLPKATVQFQPVGEGNPGPPSFGETDESGDFALEFADGKTGAVVGKHRVIVSTRTVAQKGENSDMEEEVSPEQVPESYRTEPPTFEVPRGGTQEAKIELNGPPPGKPGDPRARND
jgi:hypothetical protein